MKSNIYNTFEEYLQAQVPTIEPQGLFRPISYTLEVPGKRVRPNLLLLAYSIYSSVDEEKVAWPLAAGVEIFHNFTLLHDDLMDVSDTRRGRPTVWKKWDENTAILSGDVMLVLAYDAFVKTKSEKIAQLLTVFNRMATEICMGQQYDMEFESRDNVTVEEYMNMIRLKTSALIGYPMEMGAIAGGAEAGASTLMFKAGKDLGLAFQLQDDYLDTFGDPEVFGKPIGGDIVEGKKTYLMIRAGEEAEKRGERTLWSEIMALEDEKKKIEKVTTKYLEYGLDKEVRDKIKSLTDAAIESLHQLNVENCQPLDKLVGIIRSLAEREK